MKNIAISDMLALGRRPQIFSPVLVCWAGHSRVLCVLVWKLALLHAAFLCVACTVWGKCLLASLTLVSYHVPVPSLPPLQPVFIHSEHTKVDLFPGDGEGGPMMESHQAHQCTYSPVLWATLKYLKHVYVFTSAHIFLSSELPWNI